MALVDRLTDVSSFAISIALFVITILNLVLYITGVFVSAWWMLIPYFLINLVVVIIEYRRKNRNTDTDTNDDSDEEVEGAAESPAYGGATKTPANITTQINTDIITKPANLSTYTADPNADGAASGIGQIANQRPDVRARR